MPLKRLMYLEETINEYKRALAEGETTTITSEDYNTHLDEFNNLLELNPDYTQTDFKPTLPAGKDIIDIKEPMLSNDRFIDVNKFLSFKNSIESNIFEVKYEGVLGRLVYNKKGQLTAIHLKGDGKKAVNLIDKKALFVNVPKKISVFGNKETFITGSITCLKNDFERYCEENQLEEKTVKHIINRVLNRPNHKAASLNLHFIAHHASKNVRTKCKEHTKLLDKLANEAFITPEVYTVFPNELPTSVYPIDGVIVKSNDLKYWDLTNVSTGYYPYTGCFKYPLDTKITQIKEVIWGVNHAGHLKGVLLTTDIQYADKTYQFCHFNFPNLYIRNGIAIGSQIVVAHSDTKIPRIIGISEKGIGVALKPPVACPYCNTLLIKVIKGEYACDNEHCQGRLEWRLTKTISFRGLDISSLRVGTLKQIIKDNKLKYISDIFKISKYGIKGTNLSKSTINKIYSEINKAKDTVSLANWIFACGIYGLSESRCHLIEREIRALKSVITAELIIDFLTSIKNMSALFGAESLKIVSYIINNYDNVKDFLTHYNYKKANMERYTEKPLLAIIGKPNFRKEDLIMKLHKLGYCMDGTVNKTTTYVFATDKDSPGKIALAKRFNIRLVEAHDMTINDIIKYLEIRN